MLPSTHAALRLLIALALFLVPLSLGAAEIPRLMAPPLGERWLSVNMGDERVGFAHQIISEAPDGYRIDTEGSVKMRVMGTLRESTSKETYLVGRDLAIRSFAAQSRIDGTPLAVKGEVTPQGIKVTSESVDGKKQRTLKLKGAVYPAQILNFYPLMKGTPAGKTMRIPMLDVESVKIRQIKVEVIGRETLAPETPVVHLRNNLFPVVDNDIWVDLKGNTVKESVRDDFVLTLAESESSAKVALAEAALSKIDFALDFSLIQVVPPLERPEQLKKLGVELVGIPEDFPLLQGKGQQATRLPDGKVRFTMPHPGYQPPPGELAAPSDLGSAPHTPGDDPQIQAQKDEIVGAEKDPEQVARLLVQWVTKEIKTAGTDNQSPLETLKSRSGNGPNHARLYAALARSAGIPTRLVSGLVYSTGQGFLYHSWAESYLNGWVALDPSFGELPANVTHIKLVEGDGADQMALLAGVIGKIQAKVVEQAY